jgi:hypothetical protein
MSLTGFFFGAHRAARQDQAMPYVRVPFERSSGRLGGLPFARPAMLLPVL